MGRRTNVILFLILAACQISQASVVYISSSEGSDSNDGLTKEQPLRTIQYALSKADTIYLKSGDYFYENITVSRGMISKYGEKQLPVLCGFKRIVEPKWQRVAENIWCISLSDDNYTGFDTKGTSQLNNIGCVYEWDKKLLHGRKYQYKSQLKEDWDIWQTEHFKKEEVSDHDFDSLYLYLHDNPNNLKLAFSVGAIAIRISNSTLDHIRIEGFGFGISAGSNTTIRYCEVDAIGGMISIPSKYYVCYGNGIEFWTSREISNCLVENSVVSRCYDSGCTIQGHDAGAKNIRFRNNIIIDCCQGWEDYLRNEDPKIAYTNCFFENNFVVNSGSTSGFGYPKDRKQYCHVLGYNSMGEKGMIIRNNTFVGGNFYCASEFHNRYCSNHWVGNKCYINRGDWLLRCIENGTTFIAIPEEKGVFSSLKKATENTISQYRELTGDNTTKFIITSDKKRNRIIARLKQKFANQTNFSF